MPRKQDHLVFAINYAKRMLTNPRVKLSAVEYRRWFDRYCGLTGLVKFEPKDEASSTKPIGNNEEAPSLDDKAQEMLKRLNLGGDDEHTDSTTKN